MAFCKFRVMDRCKKSQQPCLFDEECFEPQDEPIPMTCIKMSGAILQGPADGCLVDVGEFGLLMADIKEESLVNAIYDEMQRRGVREAYIVSPDCPYHGECSKSIARLRGQWGWAAMVDLSGVCRKYIGWVYKKIQDESRLN